MKITVIIYFFNYQHDTVAVRIVDFVGANLSLSFEENMAMYMMYIVCVCCIDMICLFILAHLSQRHKKAFLIRICQFHVDVVVVGFCHS